MNFQLANIKIWNYLLENIGNYTNDPYAKNDHKYSKEMQDIRKELRKLDKETKAQGGIENLNLNDMMYMKCYPIPQRKDWFITNGSSYMSSLWC